MCLFFIFLFLAPYGLALNNPDSMNFTFVLSSDRSNLTKVYFISGNQTDFVEKSLGRLIDSEVVTAFVYNLRSIHHLIEIETERLPDDLKSLDKVKEDGALLILVGEAENNQVTRHILELNSSLGRESSYLGVVNISRGKIPDSADFMIIDHKSRMGLKRKAVETSPLRHIMDVAYIPIVATGIGALLTILLNVGKTAVEFKALDVGRKKRNLHTSKHKILGVKTIEAISLLGAATALGVGVTWTISGLDFSASILFRNIGVCLFAALSHEVSHRVVGKMFNIHIEYHFWKAGSFITLLTGYLGNTFGIQGFLMEEIKGEVSKRNIGLTKLAAPVFSTGIMVFFAYLNYLNPSELYQIIYTTASLWAMAEILPFSPLDGYEVLKWNTGVWSFFFLLITGSFLFVSFIA